MKLGDYIKQERLNRGLTQRELARECDLSFVTINSIENNKKPGIKSINVLSRFFDTEITELRRMLDEDN